MNIQFLSLSLEISMCIGKLIVVLIERMGAELILDHLFLCNPPPLVVNLLSLDKAGHVCSRLIVP